MSIMRRMFGAISTRLEQGIIPAIEYYESQDERSLISSSSDFEPFISELLKYQKMTPIIHNLIDLKINRLKEPVTLPESALPALYNFTKASLNSLDMKGVDSAIHLHYHCLAGPKVPYFSILHILCQTRPLGDANNIKLWKKIVAECIFYAIPNQISADIGKNFLEYYAKNPESYPALVKFAHFFGRNPSKKSMDNEKLELLRKLKRKGKKFFQLKNILSEIDKKIVSQSDFDYPRLKNMNDELLEAFEFAKTDEKGMRHTINWINSFLKTGESLNLPVYAIDSLMKNAKLNKEDDFIAQVYNEFVRFSRKKLPYSVVAQVMRIISQCTSTTGSYVEAMKILLGKNRKGIFNLYGVCDAILLSYIKDQDQEGALLFLSDASRFTLKISMQITKQMVDFFFGHKNIEALRAMVHIVLSIELVNDIIEKIKVLEEEFDKNEIPYEKLQYFYLFDCKYDLNKGSPFLVSLMEQKRNKRNFFKKDKNVEKKVK